MCALLEWQPPIQPRCCHTERLHTNNRRVTHLGGQSCHQRLLCLRRWMHRRAVQTRATGGWRSCRRMASKLERGQTCHPAMPWATCRCSQRALGRQPDEGGVGDGFVAKSSASGGPVGLSEKRLFMDGNREEKAITQVRPSPPAKMGTQKWVGD